MNRTYTYAFLGLVLNFVFPNSSLAANTDADPNQTFMVLSALMSAANFIIPANSSCAGNYGQSGKAAVKDMLSVQLAYLYRGDNKIVGHCILNQCKLSIEHSAGEDIFSADISFKVRKGKALVSTLHCVLTP